MDKRLMDMPNFRPNKTPVKKTVKEVIYHIVGIVLSLIFILPHPFYHLYKSYNKNVLRYFKILFKSLEKQP